jgi:4'-phosphopantetheinyl transferase
VVARRARATRRDRFLGVTWLGQSAARLPADDVWLAPGERARAAAMRVARRRADYRLGRWTAKRALARALGLPADPPSLAAIEVRAASDGSPRAFVAGEAAGVSISLSDRAGWAVCALEPGEAAIGCDLELVEPRSDAFVADYLTERERAVVEAAGPEERHRLANLIWSAKESALKVLRTGLRRDTRDVEVSLEADAPRAGWQPLQVRAVEGTVFPGWWRQDGRFLLTFAALAPGPPPALQEPPGLAGAEPLE